MPTLLATESPRYCLVGCSFREDGGASAGEVCDDDRRVCLRDEGRGEELAAARGTALASGRASIGDGSAATCGGGDGE